MECAARAEGGSCFSLSSLPPVPGRALLQFQIRPMSEFTQLKVCYLAGTLGQGGATGRSHGKGSLMRGGGARAGGPINFPSPKTPGDYSKTPIRPPHPQGGDRAAFFFSPNWGQPGGFKPPDRCRTGTADADRG